MPLADLSSQRPLVLAAVPTPSQPPDSPVLGMLRSLLSRYQDCHDGEVASYIPELAKADPDRFGICVATIDGHVYEVGDSRHRFTIQSISKPFVYGLALDDHGHEMMGRMVGVEPSGDAFNAISLRQDDGRPRNPMINAGAIATTAQVVAASPQDRVRRILEAFARYTGRPLDIDSGVYESEQRTGHRNRAIGHLLRNSGIITDDPTPVVDAYFQQCSILVDCHDLALMAVTLANRGVNPATGVRAIDAAHVESVLSVMASCGMYDSSGGWIYDVGMPAKSGVGGGVLAVLPGQFGIGVYSPRLDARGNSVRAVHVCADLSRAWELHQFNPPYCPQSSRRRASSAAERPSSRSRPGREVQCLRDHGRSIRVVELQGILSLATTEPVVRGVLAESSSLRSVLFDFQHVTGINASSTSLMADLARQLRAAGIWVLFTGCARLPEFSRALALPLGDDTGHDVLAHDSLDSGLEACEDALVRDVLHTLAPPVSDVGEYELTGGMTASQRQAFAALLTTQGYRQGERIVRQGDEAHELFLISSGIVGVWLKYGGADARRIASFSPGTMVGGIAFIDGQPRSATLVAETDVECAVLARADFESLHTSDPALHGIILRNIAIALAAKLRLADR